MRALEEEITAKTEVEEASKNPEPTPSTKSKRSIYAIINNK